MKIVTKQDIITKWITGWKEFYETNSGCTNDKFRADVMALNYSSGETDIVSIGGNVSLLCDECNENVDAVVMFEDEEGWCVCLDCLEKAQELMYATHNKV